MASASSAACAEGSCTDGPVLSLLSKRLRNLRKKYNRIVQMEEAQAQGKPLNKEQEEVVRSKPAVAALIDEYERLRQPLSVALQEEISRFSTPPPPPPKDDDEDESAVEDLVKLLYFASLFDVKPQSEFAATMLTRTHERGCCLTYDYVTDDASTDLLGERDLDAISALGALLTSRPASSGVSHRDALRGCVRHARLWLQSSDEAIHPGSYDTYTVLREKLNKIMASDYYTTTPEMKAPVDVAAAVEKYTSSCQVQVSETSVVPSPDEQVEGAPVGDQHKEDEHENHGGSQSNPDLPTHVEDHLILDEVDTPEEDITNEQDQQKLEPDTEEQQYQMTDEIKDQQQYTARRPYPNQRGGGRVSGRRGYANPRGGGGRGGRGGGGYPNGRNHYDSGYGYQARNYPNPRGRGGGRSGGTATYGAANHLGHSPRNVELNAVS
ncbi:uncharacterized protein LOC120277092 [Dioscorea cayenensis subsp. rotundata]|uniref:Uncharacterized protein LOC120277092 n=1 Tax=Dioscorea cayennensis subsp. rotundata TaxID=55577 RepID=A0AB40CLX4_DIOCR|nr:uncharacterized protein LOC120277092 [Dioscorea cayenensis subsp. rotundata]